MRNEIGGGHIPVRNRKLRNVPPVNSPMRLFSIRPTDN